MMLTLKKVCGNQLKVNGNHSVFQNKVYITNKYNLYSYDLIEKWQIPYLSIRVDSSSFELPFGRHCLRNPEILKPLSQEFRTKIIPDFYLELAKHYLDENTRSHINEIEAITVSLCTYDLNISSPWNHLPIIRLIDGQRVSMNTLKTEVKNKQKIYFTSENNVGMDYSFFDGPVISPIQPYGGKGCIIVPIRA